MPLKKKILIYDPDPISSSETAAILNSTFDCQIIGSLHQKFAPPDAVLFNCDLVSENLSPDFSRTLEITQKRKIPILCYSTSTKMEDKILYLEAGAADFIFRPFNNRELALRIRARLPQSHSPDPVFHAGKLTVHTSARRVYVGRKEIEITRSQFDILVILLKNINAPVDRNDLYKMVDCGPNTNPRVIDSQISYLRKKIEGSLLKLTAVPGVGYSLQNSVQGKIPISRKF